MFKHNCLSTERSHIHVEPELRTYYCGGGGWQQRGRKKFGGVGWQIFWRWGSKKNYGNGMAQCLGVGCQ